MNANEVGSLLAALVSSLAAAFGAWVGYLQYRDRRAMTATPSSPAEREPGRTQQTSVFERPPARPAPNKGNRDALATSGTDPEPRAPSAASRRSADEWTVDWTSEALAKRATVAVGAGAVSCLALATFTLTLLIVGDVGNETVEAFLWWVLGVGAAAILLATVLAIWVRRKARGRYRRPWRTASIALWLAWAPWIVGYLGGVVIGSLAD